MLRLRDTLIAFASLAISFAPPMALGFFAGRWTRAGEDLHPLVNVAGVCLASSFVWVMIIRPAVEKSVLIRALNTDRNKLQDMLLAERVRTVTMIGASSKVLFGFPPMISGQVGIDEWSVKLVDLNSKTEVNIDLDRAMEHGIVSALRAAEIELRRVSSGPSEERASNGESCNAQ